MECFDCDNSYSLVIEDYMTFDTDGNKVMIPNVEILRCDCGSEVFSSESSKKIEDYLESNGYVKFRKRKCLRN